MRLNKDSPNWFTSGFRYALEPGIDQDGSQRIEEYWYVFTFSFPIRDEIKEWLEKYMPGRYSVAEVGNSGDETTTHRPIYFELESDAMLFKLAWTNKAKMPVLVHVHY